VLTRASHVLAALGWAARVRAARTNVSIALQADTVKLLETCRPTSALVADLANTIRMLAARLRLTALTAR